MSETLYETSHDIIEVFEAPENPSSKVYSFKSSELTALCPFDFGGPDFYDLTLRYVPQDKCLESKSFKKYIESFRDTEITAETLGSSMYTTLEEAVQPESMYLRLEQARRGGIKETVELGDRSLRVV